MKIHIASVHEGKKVGTLGNCKLYCEGIRTHSVQRNVRHEYSDVYRVNVRGRVNSVSLTGICTKIDRGRVEGVSGFLGRYPQRFI